MARLPLRPRGPLCTPMSLAANFRALGVKQGDTLMVHSSLSSMGWVNGGAEDVIFALLDVLGDEGTLVVPSFSTINSDPSTWKPPLVSLDVPEEWWQSIRDTIPPYNPQTTRSLTVGTIAETTSFTAVGKMAAFITVDHALDCCFGESPLAMLEKMQARILLLGVGFDRCTAFHLAENRIPSPKILNSFAVGVDGVRQWMTVEDTVIGGDDFAELGAEFEKDGHVKRGLVGAANCALFSLPGAVRYATDWLGEHRVLK